MNTQLRAVLLLLAAPFFIYGQGFGVPDCEFGGNKDETGRISIFDNTDVTRQCAAWTVTITNWGKNLGFSATVMMASVNMDRTGPSEFMAFNGRIVDGTNPMTDVVSFVMLRGYAPYITVDVTSLQPEGHALLEFARLHPFPIAPLIEPKAHLLFC